MRHSTATCLATLASTLLTASAVAQSRFCIGGDLDHLSQTQKTSCSAKMQAVKAAATALRAPESWHFVLVCGEGGWKSYASFVGTDEASLTDASANTNLEQHETFLREDRLDLNNLQSLQRVVAHEVAGILLRSSDEIAINRQMKLWTDQGAVQPGF